MREPENHSKHFICRNQTPETLVIFFAQFQNKQLHVFYLPFTSTRLEEALAQKVANAPLWASLSLPICVVPETDPHLESCILQYLISTTIIMTSHVVSICILLDMGYLWELTLRPMWDWESHEPALPIRRPWETRRPSLKDWTCHRVSKHRRQVL